MEIREAGPEASEPRVSSEVALTLLPAPPLPVVMYCDGFTVGCGSTMVYCGADIVAGLIVMIVIVVRSSDVSSELIVACQD